MLRELPSFIRIPDWTFETLFWKSPFCFSPFLCATKNSTFCRHLFGKDFLHSAFRKTHLFKDQKVPSTYSHQSKMTPCVTSKGTIMGVSLEREVTPSLGIFQIAVNQVANDSLKVTSQQNK